MMRVWEGRGEIPSLVPLCTRARGSSHEASCAGLCRVRVQQLSNNVKALMWGPATEGHAHAALGGKDGPAVYRLPGGEVGESHWGMGWATG